MVSVGCAIAGLLVFQRVKIRCDLVMHVVWGIDVMLWIIDTSSVDNIETPTLGYFSLGFRRPGYFLVTFC